MPTARLRIEPSHAGLAAVSVARPDDEFRILDGHPNEDGLFVLYEIRTTDPNGVVREFEAADEVRSCEVMHRSDRVVLLRCSIPKPKPYCVANASKGFATFPLILRNGWLHVEVTASDGDLSTVKAALEDAGLAYRVDFVSQSYDSSDLLTERQREFVGEAVERGYYDTPRRCTLTELARSMGVTKGSASRTLHRAEGRIVAKFVRESR
jgi:predicted DNA binding protein